MGKKWSEKALTNTVDGSTLDPDVVKIPLLNLDEPLEADQNQFITITNFIANLISQLGVCITFTATGTATTTLQDDRLIGKDLSDVRMCVIAGTDQVSFGYLSSLDDVTGTISFSVDFGGALAVITLA